MADRCWGQLFIQPTAPDGANVIPGSVWQDTSAVPAVGTRLCVSVGPIVFGAAQWQGSGVPAVGLGSNGDTYLRAGGSVGSLLYLKAAGVWVAVL